MGFLRSLLLAVLGSPEGMLCNSRSRAFRQLLERPVERGRDEQSPRAAVREARERA